MIISNGCDKVYESGLLPIPSQPISGAVEIGNEWTEIIPPQPLKPITKGAIKVKYLNSDVHDSFALDGTSLILADGKKIKIEAVLYDDKGQSHELGVTAMGSGFHLSPKVIVETKNGKNNYSYPDFPKDRVYTKLRIRSEIPLKCENIEWINIVRH